MSRLKFWLGAAWASPVTIATLLFYVLPFVTLRWYSFLGKRDFALVYTVTDKAPTFLKNTWKTWGGQTFGNVIVLNKTPDNSRYSIATLTHEMNHVKQYMRLGVFFFVAYYFCSLVIKLGCSVSDSYYTNPLELDCRRVAGQVVDVEGAVEKLKASKLHKEK